MRTVRALQRLRGVLVRPCPPPLFVRSWSVAQSQSFSSSSAEKPMPGNSMLRHLTSKIKATGPISVAEYMREVLTNPVMGYYVQNDMLGPDGDFITSPEISQIFGELLGIWCLSEWMGAGKPSRFQLVEFGPGRGSLANDILRVFSQLRGALGGAAVSVHLVEVSPKLSQVQAQCLTGDQSQVSASEDEPVYRHGTTTTGLPISWYRNLDDVPRGFSIYLAHEFFDALPIHKFQGTEKGWREVMVDIDPDEPGKLRLVIVPAPTLASTQLIQADEKRRHVEVCPEGGVIVQRLANRITEDGGAALIADYGHDGTKMDTFRGFKGHKLHDVLASPGSADLTADVDYSYLRRMAGATVACMGPVSQKDFLKNMGIDTRLQVLLRNCADPSTRAQLIQGYDMLTNPLKMGERFQFFTMLNHSRLTRPEPEQSKGGKKMAPVPKKGPAPLPVAGFSELGLS
ncbi:protein arginine methyltransferase NDUFAF7, mitochondrial [Oncorhynchus kisutch]|uniref:Protein arginine methyltransferase NDUFAF7 n=1 Tax=Oncorhynchus kisutch TaxID=8019 RepID=A0A8C7CP08_ONCKI|nr:protein arginine methyltransferase NDUFAF7, mitochondrial [Oncorhynchus kisutch]XP_046147216.1 protein arginine methyltransferase NDUFAF7, mitochondrial [Oncorhynchus gorbuscha]XP_046147217.1 protein arginine methyltransferase NDUFAF7, mitochondrial [Oncorhynchus gorbuscha]